jgi:hypothetical protein
MVALVGWLVGLFGGWLQAAAPAKLRLQLFLSPGITLVG